MAKFITGVAKNLVLLKMLKKKEVRNLDRTFLKYLRGALKYEKFVKFNGQYVINSQFPPFPSEAFDRFISITDLAKIGKTVPGSCHIAITQRCDWNCWHCSNWHRDKVDDLPLDLLLDTIGRLQDMGNFMIGITGGEPTMRDDLEDIIRGIGPRSSTIMFTNGTGITEDRAKELKKAGLFSIAISIDTPNPEVYNKLRGHENAFNIAMEAFENAKNAGLYVVATATPTREMILNNEMPKFYDFIKDLGVHELRVLAPIPTGRIIGNRDKRWCDSDEEKQMWEYSKKLNLDKTYPRISEWSLLESEGILGCTAGTFHTFIECDGTVTPCDMIPLSFGNIKDDGGVEKAYENMANTFKVPRYECYVRASVGLFKKAFEEEGKLPFSREKTMEICSRIKNKKMPEFFEKIGMPMPEFDYKKPKVLKKEKLDVRGLPCPEPVFMTQEKIWEMETGILEVLVSEEESKYNVEKTAEREGWEIETKDNGNGEYLLVLSKK